MELSPSAVSKLTSRLGRLGLVSRVHLSGRRRLALSRPGLALLARRDRASISTAIRRWGVETVEGKSPMCWRSVPGARSRPLARAIEHTEAVHRFMAALVRQAKRYSSFRVLQTGPPHHSARYFRHGGRLRSIHPDGFGLVRVGTRVFPFFLDWERRALNPSTMSARLAPYLRYSSSNQPLDDHGHRPLVLVVFDDPLATREPAPDDEEVFSPAWPLVEEWHRPRAGHSHQGRSLSWLVTEERLLTLELAMLEEHGLTLPRRSSPCGASDARGRPTSAGRHSTTPGGRWAGEGCCAGCAGSSPWGCGGIRGPSGLV